MILLTLHDSFHFCVTSAGVVQLVLSAHSEVPLHRQRVPVQGDDDRISSKSSAGSTSMGAPKGEPTAAMPWLMVTNGDPGGTWLLLVGYG